MTTSRGNARQRCVLLQPKGRLHSSPVLRTPCTKSLAPLRTGASTELMSGLHGIVRTTLIPPACDPLCPEEFRTSAIHQATAVPCCKTSGDRFVDAGSDIQIPCSRPGIPSPSAPAPWTNLPTPRAMPTLRQISGLPGRCPTCGAILPTPRECHLQDSMPMNQSGQRFVPGETALHSPG